MLMLQFIVFISPTMYSDVSKQDKKLFTDTVGCLDAILSRDMFRSFRKLRIRAEAIPIGFPMLNERKVDVDFSGEEDSIPY